MVYCIYSVCIEFVCFHQHKVWLEIIHDFVPVKRSSSLYLKSSKHRRCFFALNLCITGAPLIIHPGRNPKAPFEILDVLEQGGADISRTAMSHLDRTISDIDELVRLAQRGCYLEFDLFGIEVSNYQVSLIYLKLNIINTIILSTELAVLAQFLFQPIVSTCRRLYFVAHFLCRWQSILCYWQK